MVGIQAIPDTCNTKCQYLNPFGTCWPQELPMEHMVVLQSNNNTWEKITTMQKLYLVMQWKPHSCIL